MNLSCEIVRDLLPLYVDGICSSQSSAAVQEHLQECDACRRLHESMCERENTCREETKDIKFTDGLSRLKTRLSRRTRIAILSRVCIALAVIGVGEMLMTQPLLDVKPEDVQVSASVYAVDDLPELEAEVGETSIRLTQEKDDSGELYSIDMPVADDVDISISVNTVGDVNYISVIRWSSDYHLREITVDDGGGEEGTLYIRGFKTSVFNNKADETIQSTTDIELRRVQKIVYVDDDGSETLLWQEDDGKPTTQIP